MTHSSPKYDLITLGRSSIDLYANEIGAPFVDIQNFAAYVGGSPIFCVEFGTCLLEFV